VKFLGSIVNNGLAVCLTIASPKSLYTTCGMTLQRP
jgi:hypothetical protein